ncbi:MAG: universal stress protein [Novosphingobium sp.]
MKNILLLAHDDPGQESRLQCALDVARAVEGHLNVIDIASPPLIAGDMGSGYAQAMVVDDAVAAEAANRARIEPRLVSEGVPYSWTDVIGGKIEAVLSHTLLNDLVVAGSHGKAGETSRFDIAGRLVTSAGRPVLAVPHQIRSMNLAGTAIVAWDGSQPADAALRAAIPLLRLASKVIIVTVGGDPMRGTLEQAAAYCSRHDLAVEAEILPAGFDRIYRTILLFAKGAGASWIVMGAFGHSRLTEAIFGGVTRSMLAEAEMPLFLAV